MLVSRGTNDAARRAEEGLYVQAAFLVVLDKGVERCPLFDELVPVVLGLRHGQGEHFRTL